MGGSGEYLVKHVPQEQEYDIVTFNIDLGSDSGISPFTVKLIGVGGIPDRLMGIETNGELEHEFIYMPVMGPDGKKWLNNNLGAEYSNINSADFAPDKQAESLTDQKAYGSMFQWQRKADGHELILPGRRPKYSTSYSMSNNTDWDAGKKEFIANSNLRWSSASPKRDLWKAGGANNPCPNNYHVPTTEELKALNDAMPDWTKENFIKLSNPGQRHPVSGSWEYIGQGSVYWSSDATSFYHPDILFTRQNTNRHLIVTSAEHSAQAWGWSIRCIHD